MTARHITLPDVPETITRSQYNALIEGAGFGVADLHSLEFKPDGIYAEVYARDENGQLFTLDGESGAMHRICVHVIDEKEVPA